MSLKTGFMPRQMTFKIGRAEYTAAPLKIDRRKLYGWSELMAVDDNGDPCELLTVDESGKIIMPPGGTGNGILSDKGRWVERSELETVDAEGKPARLYESSFNAVVVLKDKVSAQQLLDYSITDFYQLTEASPELVKAVAEDIYLFEYAYLDSYDPSPAFVMSADGTLFLLVAERNAFEWLCFGDCETLDEDFQDEILGTGDKDIDFSMF